MGKSAVRIAVAEQGRHDPLIHLWLSEYHEEPLCGNSITQLGGNDGMMVSLGLGVEMHESGAPMCIRRYDTT